ncbi:MAG TPA: LuxR C-terminal-related transcriptional regulator, partial [Solirubrobacteraceae bacterium]|nr:LuxR C-terminal-related transcriptional regulator [Solirubrobacteraceae bacterium]
EVLSHLKDQEAAFLIRTAPLTRMCGSLCDAVLGRTDSAAMLDSLERSTGFVMALNGPGHWYRCHNMLHAMLAQELEHREPGTIPALHRRAAEWYEHNEESEDAIEHAFAGGDLEHAARLVAACQLDVYQDGRLEALGGWLAQIDQPGLLERHPMIASWGAWTHGLSGHPAEAARWAEKAEHESGTREPGTREPGHVSATIEPCQATLRVSMCRHGAERMRAEAERALELIPPWSCWRSTASMLLGVSLVLCGADDRADEVLSDATVVAENMGMHDDHSICLAKRSLLAAARRDFRGAERFAQKASQVVRDAGLEDYATSAVTYVALMRVALHRRDLPRAEEEFARADRLRPRLTWFMPTFASRVRLELVRYRLATADAAGARMLLQEVDHLLRQFPSLGVLNEQAAQLRGQVEQMSSFSVDAAVLTGAEQRVLSLLCTHLTIGEIAERQFVSRATVKTQAISIYRKLNVTSRSEAVQRAADIGLVDSAVVPPPRDFHPSG